MALTSSSEDPGSRREGRQTRGLQQPPSTRRSLRGVWAPPGLGWRLGPGPRGVQSEVGGAVREAQADVGDSPSRHPAPLIPPPRRFGSASREAERAVLQDSANRRPARDWAAAASRSGGGGAQVCLSWAAPARSSAASPWPGCSLCSCSCSRIRWDGNGGAGAGRRGSRWADPRIPGGRCAGARAPVRLAPAGGP